MPIYSAPPQAESYSEDAPPSIYGTEAIVSLALRNDHNCLEWLGHDINRKAPRIVPEGYIWNARHQIAVPPGFAYCTGCKQVHPLSAFGADERSTGRGKTRSQCRMWEAREKTKLNRKKLHRKWKRG